MSLLFPLMPKKVPVALHLTSESRKTGFYEFLMKIGKILNVLPKILGYAILMGFSANFERK